MVTNSINTKKYLCRCNRKNYLKNRCYNHKISFQRKIYCNYSKIYSISKYIYKNKKQKPSSQTLNWKS